jgi:ubiquitin carboxyl-terminal hydrolase 10
MVEVVKDVWSSVRGENVDATKQVLLEVCPKVLVLHLKRFVYERDLGGVGKRGKLVSFGKELVVPPGRFYVKWLRV